MPWLYPSVIYLLPFNCTQTCMRCKPGIQTRATSKTRARTDRYSEKHSHGCVKARGQLGKSHRPCLCTAQRFRASLSFSVHLGGFNARASHAWTARHTMSHRACLRPTFKLGGWFFDPREGQAFCHPILHFCQPISYFLRGFQNNQHLEIRVELRWLLRVFTPKLVYAICHVINAKNILNFTLR